LEFNFSTSLQHAFWKSSCARKRDERIVCTMHYTSRVWNSRVRIRWQVS
jgi:hypothetical protein